MEIGETLYVTKREEWRKWLESNYDKAPEIWLVYYNKKSGKPRIAYDQAVEEALCFGWIDSIVKKIDDNCTAQRFSPRRKRSQLSELNKVRVKKMIEEGKMTPAGLLSINHHLQYSEGKFKEHAPFTMPKDILKILKSDPITWKNFNAFPEDYKQVRIAYIDHARIRPEEFKKRLNYFLKMTKQNKLFGSLR
ncbi:MAG TPA: YdeI/OmpD-associated family protein [Bacteroidales bacterium]|jgi:uncharacterized protein YdeI (YjbR/CyaY-like superfamily)|nr:YdeI/OmpD-associated family protein [Bacteroidales bacterium]